jgi:hypothetical protein
MPFGRQQRDPTGACRKVMLTEMTTSALHRDAQRYLQPSGIFISVSPNPSAAAQPYTCGKWAARHAMLPTLNPSRQRGQGGAGMEIERWLERPHLRLIGRAARGSSRSIAASRNTSRRGSPNAAPVTTTARCPVRERSAGCDGGLPDAPLRPAWLILSNPIDPTSTTVMATWRGFALPTRRNGVCRKLNAAAVLDSSRREP